MRQITPKIIVGLGLFSVCLIPTHAGLTTESSPHTEWHSQIVDKSDRETGKWGDGEEENVASLTVTSSQELIQQINRYSHDLSHPNSTTSWTETTDVYRLDDVSPDDWASEVLQRLHQNYSCLSGDPDGTFRGSRTLTRYEFAAALETCWKQIENLIVQTHNISQDDLTILRRLIDDFAVELANLESQINRLENQAALLESLQFSTTTKLNGQVVFGNNFGNFEGDRIIDPKGRELANSDPQATFLYRASLDFDTSFRGDDLLKVRVDTGSNGTLDNATGLLEPNFGSILDISNSPPRSAIKGVGRVYYQFQVRQNLSVTVGPLIEPMDFFDKNRYANLSFRDFSTENFVYNYVLFAISGIGAGGVVEWNPNGGALSLRTLYIAADAASASENEPGIVPGVAPYAQLLYSNGTGERGLFGDFYQTMVELEYAPSSNFTLRLLYSGGEIFDRRFDGVGVNFEWAILPQMGVFGRYGYSSYEETDFGDINPNYWMIGVSGLDLFKPGDRAGFATGQPFIASGIGNATQTNLEVFYHYPINDNIQIAPVFQMILDSSNQDSNGTIFTGTFRTVFSF